MIALNQHRKGFTTALVARFTESVEVKDGLQAFFPVKTTTSKYVSIEVMRMGKKMAVDVQRCTDPNRNIFSRSTEKIFMPPYFHEAFDFTACQSYDLSFGRGIAPDEMNAKDLMVDALMELNEIKNKIKRSIQKQYADVLQTGIVTLKNGDNIDYKRKAASLEVITGATSKWSDTVNSNPAVDLQRGAEFLRSVGRSSGAAINAIFGSAALANFLANSKMQASADFRRIDRISIVMPEFDNVTGMSFNGQFAAGDFIINIWTFNESYEDATGADVPFIDPNTVILLPNDFKGLTVFAGLPMVFGDQFSGQYIANVEAEFLVYDVIDQVKRAWQIIVDSAPLVIPVTVDKIWTIKTS